MTLNLNFQGWHSGREDTISLEASIVTNWMGWSLTGSGYIVILVVARSDWMNPWNAPHLSVFWAEISCEFICPTSFPSLRSFAFLSGNRKFMCQYQSPEFQKAYCILQHAAQWSRASSWVCLLLGINLRNFRRLGIWLQFNPTAGIRNLVSSSPTC
jgi:hypothetical protein